MSVSRWARLGQLTTKLAGSVVSESIADAVRSPVERIRAQKRAQQRRAEELVSSLRRLKGAAMKLGQQAAVFARHLDLPDEVRERLGDLHDNAEPVDFEVIRATVERELGPLSERFATFDEAPVGTASLAQAHAATLLDGTEVVVKVLHPGIDESVRADLLAVRALLLGGRAMGRPAEEMRDMFDELEERLTEELDYEQEARNIAAFREAFGDDPRFRIPRVHEAYCTRRVLTMDRLHGLTVDAFVAASTPETRNRAGLNLADLFFESTFVHRTLHADPHPGNFLFEPDGRVGVLDFGCVKRFEPTWIGQYAALVSSALQGDREATLTATRAIGAWTGDDPEAGALIIAFCDAVVTPLREGPHTIGGSDDELLERLVPITKQIWQFTELRGPRHLLFLHRTLAGMYTLARTLETTADWPPLLQPHLDHAVAVAAGAPAS